MVAAAVIGGALAFAVIRAVNRSGPRLAKGKPPDSLESPSPAGQPLVTFRGDGAVIVHTGGGQTVRLNHAEPEPDAREPRRDPIAVAQDLVREGAVALPGFADAVALLTRRGVDRPAPPDARSRAIAALTERLLRAEDPAHIREVLRELDGDGDRWLIAYALVGTRAAEIVFEGALRAGAPLGWQPVRALAMTAPEHLREPLAALTNIDDRIALIGRSIVDAAKAGREDAVLLDRWRALGAELEGDDDRLLEHREHEIERLAHVDADAACALWAQAREEWGTPDAATPALLRALAAQDPDRARAWLKEQMEVSPEPFDWLPAVAGCRAGGLDVSAELALAADRIHPSAYRPASVFGTLVDVHLRAGDLAALEHVLRRGGAHRWQTALYASDAVRDLARGGPADLAPALELLLAKYEPGAVASRDASAGLAAGHVMMRPPEHALRTVHPSELLVLHAAMSEPTPEWRLS